MNYRTLFLAASGAILEIWNLTKISPEMPGMQKKRKQLTSWSKPNLTSQLYNTVHLHELIHINLPVFTFILIILGAKSLNCHTCEDEERNGYQHGHGQNGLPCRQQTIDQTPHDFEVAQHPGSAMLLQFQGETLQ